MLMINIINITHIPLPLSRDLLLICNKQLSNVYMHKSYPVLIACLLMVALYPQSNLASSDHECHPWAIYDGGFVQTHGTRFVKKGKPLYVNGFNAYWMMYMASDPATCSTIPAAFQQASEFGLTVTRTWAFSDGAGNRPLQISPGTYSEDMFKGLDFVISEAGKHGIHLIPSLVNNWNDFGGKNQYVQWGKERGVQVSNDDDFFSNPTLKQYYKNHVNAVLTRINSITGVAYKDDTNIFAWELMNEPRCQADYSGATFQSWVEEMSAYVKSIDANHMLEIGLEGFYGETTPERREQVNPGGWVVGTDFITNNQLTHVDFATIHLYPDQWTSGDDKAQLIFVDKWVEAHIEDSNTELKKPIMLTEFGKSSRSSGYDVEARDKYFGHLFDAIYSSASEYGSCAGGLFWQVLAPGMSNWDDGYGVVLEDSPSTAYVINQQSNRLAKLSPTYDDEKDHSFAA